MDDLEQAQAHIDHCRQILDAMSPSTTWRWGRVKIGRPAGGQGGAAPAGRHVRQLPRRNPRDPLTVSISYRGGPEAWWELRARGVVLRRPGHQSLHDVLSELQGTL